MKKNGFYPWNKAGRRLIELLIDYVGIKSIYRISASRKVLLVAAVVVVVVFFHISPTKYS